VWCVSEDGGKSCFAYDHIIDEVNAASCGILEGSINPFMMKATYSIHGNEICYEIRESSGRDALPVGDRFCAVILSTNKKQETYRFTDSDEVFTMYKTRLKSPPCIDGA